MAMNAADAFSIPQKYRTPIALNKNITETQKKRILSIYYHVSRSYLTKNELLSDAYTRKGNLKYMAGNYKGAIKDYTAAIKLKSDNSKAWYYRGLAKVMNNIKGATIDYIQANQLSIYTLDRYSTHQLIQVLLDPRQILK